METHIARQPILNSNKRLFAYELLYRGVNELSMPIVGGDRATTALLTSSFLTEGLQKISSNKPCFINFTEDLLVQNIAENFPKNKIYIEILEDVQPTQEVIEACTNLKMKGYKLALDDFVYDKNLLPLIELADIIKFDFQLSTIDEINKAIYHLSQYKIQFLAEKVETHEEFSKALKLGCKYFQGYFFAKPELIQIKEVASSKISLLQLLAEINQKSISTDRMTTIISADVSLSYRLLRYINSAYFYLLYEIDSIAHAVAYLGENEIKRFVSLIAIAEISSNKPLELVRLAAVRAKLCELLSVRSPKQTDPHELFMLGLFSLLPAMLDGSMNEILAKLPISNDIKRALNRNEGPLAVYLNAVVFYERQKKNECAEALKVLQIPRKEVYDMYFSAVRYADILSRPY